MRDLWREVRIALRTLARTPSVTLPVVIVWALGIGTAVALYAVVYAMWLRPLPYASPDRLVSVAAHFPTHNLDALASADYAAWQGTKSLGPLAAYSTGTAVLIGHGDPFEVSRANVSGNLLDVLKVSPALGRGIQVADDDNDAPKVALLCDTVWRQRFGADRSVIGRSVRIEGTAYTIVGVLPHGFRMPDDHRIDVLTPLALDPMYLRHDPRGAMRILRGLGRLQPGATIDGARAELTTKLAQSRALLPKLYGTDVSIRVIPLEEYVVRGVRTTGMVLAAVVAALVLVAAANVASLLVARAAGRTKEMEIRAALGADRMQIAGHLLTEGMLTAITGTAAGLFVAEIILRAVERLRPSALVALDDVRITGPVLAVALPLLAACSLAFSIAPVLPLRRQRVRRALVVVELGVSLVLLTTAGLLLQTLNHLRSVAPGFRTDQIVTASIGVRGSRFENNTAELGRAIFDRLAAIPGNVGVAFANAMPPSDHARTITFSRSDRQLPESGHPGDLVLVRLVTPDFFRTMGIPLRQGRIFTAAEAEHDELVAVVNQTLVDRYFHGENPVGKQVDGLGIPWKAVVGVVSDFRNDGLRNPTMPEIDLPYSDVLRVRGGGVTQDHGLNIVIRTSADPGLMMNAFRTALRELDSSLLANVRTMDEQWSELRAGPRFHAVALAAFAGLACIMASAGLFGVLSHAVELRRREMGIRLALGATPANVQGLIIREALLLAGTGIGVGAAAALAFSRVLTNLLFEVKGHDPVILTSAAAVMLAVAVAASAVPARRASREDPAKSLRAE